MINNNKSQIITHLNHSEFFNQTCPDYDNSRRDESGTISFKLKKIIFRIIGNKKKWIPPAEKIDGSKMKRVIIFRNDGIGDYIVSTPVIRWLRQALPKVEIDVLTSFRNDAIVKQDPYVCLTYPIHHKRIFHKSVLKLYKLRKNNYDVIICLDYTKTTNSAILARIIAPNAEKITVLHPARKDIYGLVFNRQTKINVGSTQWSRNMLNFVTENIKPEKDLPVNECNPYVFIHEKDYLYIKPLVDNYHLKYSPNPEKILSQVDFSNDKKNTGENKYCILNISAFKEGHSLTIDLAVDTCKCLAEKYNSLIVFVTGVKEDFSKVEQITKKINKSNCVELKLNLSEFIAFLAGAEFVITPDTATVHLAAAAGVPVIGIYTSTDSARTWYPYDVPFSIVLSANNKNVDSIETGEILEATEILVNWLNKGVGYG